MSGLDAVRKIVETEGQARKIVDESKMKAQQIISQTRDQAEVLRQESISSAHSRREETLKQARQKAETEARQSDVETDQLIANYQRLAGARKADAVDKAVELILNA